MYQTAKFVPVPGSDANPACIINGAVTNILLDKLLLLTVAPVKFSKFDKLARVV